MAKVSWSQIVIRRCKIYTPGPTSCCVSAGYWEVQLIHPPDNYYRILDVWPRNPGAEAEVQQSMCSDCYQSSTTRRREPRKKNQSMIKDQFVTSCLYPYWYSANRKLSSPSPKSQSPKSQSQDQRDFGWHNNHIGVSPTSSGTKNEIFLLI